MARSGVPDISEKALWVGIGLAEIVAITSVFLGVVLIFSRDIEISSEKKSTNWNRNWLSFSYSWSY